MDGVVVAPDEQSFSRWAGERQLALLRTAVLLTGDRRRAEGLVRDALTQTAVRWRRLRAGDPDAYARQVVVRRNMAWCKAVGDEHTADDAPGDAVDDAADEGALLDRALATLTASQRAAVVLRCYDDLATRETAEALGVTTRSVVAESALGLSRLRKSAPSPTGSAGRAAREPHRLSEQDLRPLLQERVEELTTTDLSADAWRTATRLRARRRTRVIAVVATSALAVGGVTAIVTADANTRSARAPSPDAVVGGAPVFWSPDPAAEEQLPAVEEERVLPPTIDLAGGVPDVEDAPVERATAAFAVHDGSGLGRIVLLTPDGYRTLTLPDSADRARAAQPALSADGTSLHLSSPDGSAATYSFAAGHWRGERLDARPPPERPPQVAGAASYGPAKPSPSGDLTAQSYGPGAAVRAPPGSASRPPTVVVTPRLGPPTILVLDAPRSGGRPDECCPVVGWLDDRTIVYESRGGAPKLVAWRVGTDDFTLVSRIEGLRNKETYAASFAGLTRQSAGVVDADATVASIPVWWSPDLGQEQRLPWLPAEESPLPREIRPPSRAGPLPAGFGPAIAALARGDGQVLVLDSRGRWAGVPIAGRGDPGPAMLSEDGRRLLLKLGRQYSILDLASGRWSTFSARLLPQPPRPTGLVGPNVRIGAARTSPSGLVAQAWATGGPMLPVPDASRYYAGPSYLTVTGGTTRVLAFPTAVGTVRAPDTPTVAGWLDDDTVVYQSRSRGRDLLVAWDIGTRVYRRVATVRDAVVSSFAALHDH